MHRVLEYSRVALEKVNDTNVASWQANGLCQTITNSTYNQTFGAHCGDLCDATSRCHGGPDLRAWAQPLNFHGKFYFLRIFSAPATTAEISCGPFWAEAENPVSHFLLHRSTQTCTPGGSYFEYGTVPGITGTWLVLS